MKRRISAALCLAVTYPFASACQGAAGCEPDGDVQFVCGPANPEDLIAVPESLWVIVVSMVDEGHLYGINSLDHTSMVLFPTGASQSRHDTAKYGACPGPVTREFRPHGINLRPGNNRLHTLYVVGHGAREAVEVFELDARGATPSLTWVGCAVAPENLGLNAVVPLPDGGFAATSPRTGDVWEWHGAAGWSPVPGSEGIGPNGLEISRDGQWFYVAGYGSQSVIRLSRGRTPVQKDAAEVGFHIDNVHWAPDGSLLAAGHLGPTREAIGTCLRERQCEGIVSRVAKVYPDSFAVEQLVRYPSNDLVILGTVAIQLGDELWVGGVGGGERIARFQAPAPRSQTELPNPYRLVEGWPTLPDRMNRGRWGELIRADLDPSSNIWVFHRCFNTEPAGAATCVGRSEPPILKFDPSGRLLTSFGEGMFAFPHGFTVDGEGNVWASDANANATVLGLSARGPNGLIRGHQVFKFSPTGRVLMTLGKAGVAGDGPDTFDQPTGIAVAPDGDIFVTDGHGKNERVGWIVQRGAARDATTMAATVGFVSRANAVSQLRGLAEVPGPFSATTLREMAALIEQGPPQRKVQCAVVGWCGSAVLELEPDDLRALAPKRN